MEVGCFTSYKQPLSVTKFNDVRLQLTNFTFVAFIIMKDYFFYLHGKPYIATLRKFCSEFKLFDISVL